VFLRYDPECLNAQTGVAPFAVRARPRRAGLATPIFWEAELDDPRSLDAVTFALTNVLDSRRLGEIIMEDT
jgi:DNA primase